jgi:hypothetical protein
MKQPPPGAGRRAGRVADSFEQCLVPHSSTRHRIQPCPANSLARLRLFRFSLDCWRACGCPGEMPQPADFDLRLPPLTPEAVLW